MKVKKFVFISLMLLLVFIIYSFSLNREWQFFDEKGMYVDEKLFPAATSFSEIFEIIKTYALSYHIDSQNAFFSNIITIRSNLLGAILNIFLLYFFHGNAFYYHLLEVILHLINTVLVWLILFKLANPQKETIEKSYLLPTLFTLIWALHPTNTEAVLLGTNWPSLLTYSFCLGFFLFTLIKISNDSYNCSKLKTVLIIVLFFLSVLISEYNYTLPFILFFTVFAFSLKKLGNYKKSFISSLRLTLPYYLGLVLFFFYYLIRNIIIVKNFTFTNQIYNFSFERLFWFTPQLFIHFLKLIFYPKDLSLYQSNLIYLPDSLFHPYAIFSVALFLIFITLPVIFILNNKKNYLFLLTYCFLFSLLPFLHVISPTYCLIADRYCYFPVFILVFSLAGAIHELPQAKFKTPLVIFLFVVLLPLSVRTVYRIHDWKDSSGLYNSAAKCSKDKLYRGKIYSILGYYFDLNNDKEKMKKYMLLSIKNLKAAIKELEDKKAKYPYQPQTLVNYGLDIKSQITTCAFAIASARFNNFKENAKDVLNFYEPYIKENLKSGGNSQIDLYAKLLLATGQKEKAKEILEFAKNKYPFSPTIIFTLGNLYLNEKDLVNATKIIEEGFHFYPSYTRSLIRMIKLNELKNNALNLAKYEYLLGLRTHSKKGYQKAAQLYLFLTKLKEAKVTLDKLLILDKENPITLFLLSKYYYLDGKKDRTLELLTKAYLSCKKPDAEIDLPMFKSILLSLVSFNISNGDLEIAKKYIYELEQFPLTKDEKNYLEAIKKKISS